MPDKMKNLLILFFVPVLFLLCSAPKSSEIYKSESLEIHQLTPATFIHKSFLETESFGKVSCNGLIFISNNEAIVFDTPTNNSVSKNLIQWIKSELNCDVKAVVPTHFHDDCLGGLSAFHDSGIESYANNLTLSLAESDGGIVPKNGFEKRFELFLGGKKAIIEFPGEGHTLDNVVGYIPSENVLFGGCLIKSLNASKGYLADGNEEEWSNTVSRVKSAYAEVEYVVPGHGEAGGVDLLDYTIELFRTNK